MTAIIVQKARALTWWQWTLVALVGLFLVAWLVDVVEFYGWWTGGAGWNVWAGVGQHNVACGVLNGRWWCGVNNI